MLNGFCALCTPFVRDGVLFNHLIKLLKFFIDQKSQSVKVRLVLTAKLVRTDGVFHRSMRCPGGEIGRHKGFKIPRLSSRAGSSPARGTITLKDTSLRRVGRVAMQRIANPWTSVRLRDAPPLFSLVDTKLFLAFIKKIFIAYVLTHQVIRKRSN